MREINLHSMMKADRRRMFVSPMFYIMAGIALLMPVLILVMTTMMEGTTVTDPQTGAVTTISSFTNTWQIIGTESGADLMAMDITSMCNINLVYFLAGVLVCLFVAEDFRSGYAKNLFSLRVKKREYVFSKTFVCYIASAFLLLFFFAGAMIGGAVSGLPFTLGAAGVFGIVLCLLSKLFLMAVFVAIALLVSSFGKSRAWLSILLFLFGGMLLFMMIPMLTPLNATFLHAGLCLVGGVIFALGIGYLSNMVLLRQDLV